jgi:hypothetical protein
MNKTLQEIISQILTLKNADPVLSEIDTTSKVSVWRQFIEVVGFVIFNFQEACKLHMKEIDDKIANQKVPSLPWYRNLALNFQYGFDLHPSSLVEMFLPTYQDNGVTILATPEQIEASKIIKYAAVTSNIDGNGRVKISMKIAGENMDEVLSDEKTLSFVKFIEEKQAAGDNIVVVNYLPDILDLKFKIAYNPLILHSNGMSIITGKYPVQDTIKEFMKNLPFNGELSVQRLREAIKATEGVNDLLEIKVASKWIVPGIGYGQFQPIEISRIPKSGRFKIEDWTGFEYINYQAVP